MSESSLEWRVRRIGRAFGRAPRAAILRLANFSPSVAMGCLDICVRRVNVVMRAKRLGDFWLVVPFRACMQVCLT